MLAPLFDDGTFEYIPIPEARGGSGPTYRALTGTKGLPLSEYFPPSQRTRAEKMTAHLDPEFETFTYGDPTIPKRSLADLRPGDILVFYAGLRRPGATPGTALHIIGYFEVEVAGTALRIGRDLAERRFAANYHVRHRDWEQETAKGLLLVAGGPGSRLLERAVCIGAMGRASSGRPVQVLSEAARSVLGSFTELNAIERSVPRWVQPVAVEGAAAWLRSLA